MMNLHAVTTQTVTNASGTIAIASATTGMGVTKVVNAAPVIGAEHLINTAGMVLSVAEITGICSAVILVLSFFWNVISTRRRLKIKVEQKELDEKYYTLRKYEYELELAKYKANQHEKGKSQNETNETN